MSKKYKSNIKAALHQTMSALYKIKAIDKKTMNNFDKFCLQRDSRNLLPCL